MLHIINETLQWVFLIILATPKVVQVVKDFKEDEEEE